MKRLLLCIMAAIAVSINAADVITHDGHVWKDGDRIQKAGVEKCREQWVFPYYLNEMDQAIGEANFASDVDINTVDGPYTFRYATRIAGHYDNPVVVIESSNFLSNQYGVLNHICIGRIEFCKNCLFLSKE